MSASDNLDDRGILMRAPPDSAMKILFVSTPVGPLGSGLGGGVELTVRNAAEALGRRGHHVRVIAPAGSQLAGIPLVQASGNLQVPAQHQGRDAPIQMPASPVLGEMWEQVRRLQGGYDRVLNFAYDWLPFYLTPFLDIPVAHLVSMSSLGDAMDQAIGEAVCRRPGSVGMHTRAQAVTFPHADRYRLIGNGLDIDRYPFSPNAEPRLCWVGRIAPEKGLEDAVAVARATGMPLDVFGTIQDEIYWRQVRRASAGATLRYHGFLATDALAQGIGRCQALLMTPKWTEAFGNVVIEALACGVPVIAYRRGGPAELIDHGRTGWLVEPDSVDGLIEGVLRVGAIDRGACREQAERNYSLPALGARLERWLADLPVSRLVVPGRAGDHGVSAALA